MQAHNPSKQANELLIAARLATRSPVTGSSLSRTELAEQVQQWVTTNRRKGCGIDAVYVGKLERGDVRWPNADYRAALRELLCADSDTDLGFRPAPNTHGTPRHAMNRREFVGGVESDADHGFWNSRATRRDSEPVNRREFLGGAAAFAASAALPDTQPEVVPYLSGQLASHWQADRSLGPHLLIETVVPQCRTVIRLAGATSNGLRYELLQLAVGYTGLVGWLYQDAGDLTACSRWLDRTLELGHRSGDPQLIAYALTCKAMVSADERDGLSTVELADAALNTTPNLCAKAKVLALQRAASGYALLGDCSAVDQQFDVMTDLLGDVDDRLWGRDRPTFTPEDVLTRHRATCYGWLGMNAEAADLWASVPASQAHRDAGVHHARRAVALLEVGKPQEAAEHAAEGIQYLERTGSARMRHEFNDLAQRAEHWRDVSAGRDLINVLEEAHGGT